MTDRSLTSFGVRLRPRCWTRAQSRGQPTGFVRKRDVSLQTYDTFAEATDAWQHAEVQERRRTGGSSVQAGRMLFADLVALYLESTKLEASTRRAYASHCRRHLLPRFDQRPIADLTSAEIGRWMNDQRKAQLSVRMRLLLLRRRRRRLLVHGTWRNARSETPRLARRLPRSDHDKPVIAQHLPARVRGFRERYPA